MKSWYPAGYKRVAVVVLVTAAAASFQSCTKPVDVSDTGKEAQTLLAGGKSAAAESLLNSRLKALGLNDGAAVQRASLLCVLGRVYLKEEKPAQAEPCFLEAVSITERKFGIDSQELLEPLDGLRQSQAQQKKYNAAEKNARRMLAIAESHYKPNDPRLESAISNVLAVACIGGKCQDETELDKRLVAIREQVYGRDNQSTRAARLILAESYRHKKDYAEVIKLLQQNVESCRKAAPAELITALNNVAHAMELGGQTKEASATVDEALELEERNGDKVPQQKLSSLRIKARVLAQEGKYKESEKVYEELIEKFRSVFHDRNPHLADLLVDYSDVLDKLGKKDAARKAKAEAESIYKR